ncbi:hypothetical protein TTHERM_00146020 (macronuclear) [Tetrahymena thermophila SB210]|uniref:Uncharacterized protein n=1 Tax=Tetrahymena thermophila (strain SB210) TaxID=312017 RepID=I7M0V2_TETTS|nr:hypothetical protein TTHERM_00146020 [Tetrahymena thermophila SB210]EAR90996.4 hypothetical protein TTHERM_00146020 [Tetrahymena thermophila SB210]|eukprot:XP_001011241.4 hypothetical protein TTHERM_00146020 [Tetrahymena thermophila SB210]
MKKVIPRISRKFPEEFYSEDRLNAKSQMLNDNQLSNSSKYNNEQPLSNSPSQQVSTFEDDTWYEKTANFNINNKIMRVSQSQDSIFKQSKIEQKKQMDFTFCATEKQKNPMQIPFKILPPLLQKQSKQIQEYEIHPLNVYQLDRFVKPMISKEKQQMNYSEINQSEADSKLANDQTQASEFKNGRRREDDSIDKQINENERQRFQSLCQPEKDLQNIKINIVNMIGRSNFVSQSQILTTNQQKIFTKPSPVNISLVSNSSGLENIHPNISCSNIQIGQKEQIKKKKQIENKTRQYCALPCSQSVSRGRDPLILQQKMSTLNNPTRQSYQSLLQGELKINQNSFQLNNINCPQLNDQKDEFLAEENRLNNFQNVQSQQNENEFIQKDLRNIYLLKNNNNLKQQLKQASESLDPKMVNKIEIQTKILNNYKIAQLPLLNKLQNNSTKLSREQYQIFNTQNNNLFKKQSTNTNKPFNSISSKITDTSCYSVANGQCISRNPSPLILQQKTKLNNCSCTYISNNLKTDQDISILSFKKINYNQQLQNSPKTEPVKPTYQIDINQNQLDKLQNPEWFYNQLGRPNLLSYQEKREKAIQYYQRNIHSQQQKQNDQQNTNQNNLRQKLVRRENNSYNNNSNNDCHILNLKSENAFLGLANEEILIEN